MLIEQTLNALRKLKLTGMAEGFERQRMNASLLELPFEDRFGMLLQSELLSRDNKRLKRLTRDAHLKVNASVEDIDYRASRGLNKKKVATLASCNWIESRQNLIFTGATGVGKTWMACAFANQAIRMGIPVVYYRFSRLLEELQISRDDGSLAKLRARLDKAKLLILDDWGLPALNNRNREDLLDLVDDRSGNGSIAITSQLPIDKWHDYLGEPTLADAILDRIVHNSHRFELEGDSMRKMKTAIV